MCAWIHACYKQITYRYILKVQLEINQEKYLDMKHKRLPEISWKSLLKWKTLSSFIPHFSQDADEVELLDNCTASPSTQQSVPHTPGKHGEQVTQDCAPRKHGPWEMAQKYLPGISRKFIDLKVISWHTFNLQPTEVPNRKWWDKAGWWNNKCH